MGAKASAGKRATHLISRVRIAGVAVGGLDSKGAAAAVRTAFAKKLPIVIGGTTVSLNPTALATPYVAAAVAHAGSAPVGANVHLVVSVHGAAVRAVAARLAKRFDQKAAPAKLALKLGSPTITPAQTGKRLVTGPLVASIVRALSSNTRLTLHAVLKTTPPPVSDAMFRSVIVINRSLNRLSLFTNAKLARRFPVATGQAIYPTPTGRFQIVVKQMNPWWYPPTNNAWAKGLKPVPPGPFNPLGTRWMGLSVPGVGIHGTDEPGSIGYSASHGCIRMQVPDAEWLFTHVDVGTTVIIV